MNDICAKDAKKTIYQLSYVGAKGDRRGSDGDFGGTVSPDYSFVEEKTNKRNSKILEIRFHRQM